MMFPKILSVITLAASSVQLAAQGEKTATAPPTLPELAVEAKPIKKLNWAGSTPIDEYQVENRGIGSISDLSGIAPNFYVNSNGIQSYGDVITIRGIGNTQLFGDPAVILYIDGVPAASTATYSSALFDVESVEVLRGFQGHRFGKNSPGGVINVNTRRPGDTHRSKLFASYGSFDTQNYRVLADGPMSKSSSYYFGLNRSSSDGFADNLAPAGNDATSESLNGRLGFNWVTESGLEIGIGGTWEEFDLGAQPVVPRANGGNPNYTNFYSRNSSLKEMGKMGSNSQYLGLAKETGFGRVRSITSRNDWNLDPNLLDLNFVDRDLASLIPGLASVGKSIASSSQITEFREQWAEELIVESAANEESHWQLGTFLSFNQVDGKSNRIYPTTTSLAPTDPTDPNYLALMGAYLFSFYEGGSITSHEQESNSYALFGNTSQSLTAKTSLELGLRMDYVTKDMTRTKTTTSNVGHNWSVSSRQEEDYLWFTPSVGINHELNDNAALFVRTSFAGKPGGFSPYVDSNSSLSGMVSATYGKERIWSHEIGGVLSGDSGNWNIGITAYWNEVADYQFEKPSGGHDYYVDNAEEASIKGIEVDVNLIPTDGWLLSLGYGLCDAEIEKHSAMSLNQTLSGADTYDFAGKTVPFTPEYTLNASISHQLTENLNWRVGVRNIGDIHYLDQRAEDTVNDSYTLLDASIGYERNGWGVSVFGTNLTDEEYYSSLVSSLTGSPGIVGSPRVIGLNLSKEF
jgi:iron complex outermembrane receptor protein